MFSEGLGEDSEFSGFHPWVNLIYYVLVIGITMFSMSPWFLVATLIMSWMYSVILKGVKQLKTNVLITVWSVILFSVINALFSHNGETVMFFLNGNRVTVEAMIYGASVSVMFSNVVVWFSGFNVIMTAEKLIYIFGKAAPVLGLTLSMIFRYIPLLKARYQEIKLGQTCLGRNIAKEKGLVAKVRQFGKEISILISWSLESSIEGADSMEARGYGLRGRTSFHLYRFSARDGAILFLMILLAAGTIYGMAHGRANALFYPRYELMPFDMLTFMSLACFVLLAALPMIMDVYGEIRWNKEEVTS